MPVSEHRAKLIANYRELLSYDRMFDDPVDGGVVNQNSPYWTKRLIHERGPLATGWSAFNRVMLLYLHPFREEPYDDDPSFRSSEQNARLAAIRRFTRRLKSDMITLWTCVNEVFPDGQYWRAEIHDGCDRCDGHCHSPQVEPIDKDLWDQRMQMVSQLLYRAIFRADVWNEAVAKVLDKYPIVNWDADAEWAQYWETMSEWGEDWQREKFTEKYLQTLQ